jgi:hypothetical protein
LNAVLIGELLSEGGENGVENRNGGRRRIGYCLLKLIRMLLDPIHESAKSSPVNPQATSAFIDRGRQFSKCEMVLARPRFDNQVTSGSLDQAIEHGECWITLSILDTRDRGGGNTGLGSKRTTRKTRVSSNISEKRSTIHDKG